LSNDSDDCCGDEMFVLVVAAVVRSVTEALVRALVSARSDGEGANDDEEERILVIPYVDDEMEGSFKVDESPDEEVNADTGALAVTIDDTTSSLVGRSAPVDNDDTNAPAFVDIFGGVTRAVDKCDDNILVETAAGDNDNDEDEDADNNEDDDIVEDLAIEPGCSSARTAAT
jgi:hypothetical protein